MFLTMTLLLYNKKEPACISILRDEAITGLVKKGAGLHDGCFISRKGNWHINQ